MVRNYAGHRVVLSLRAELLIVAISIAMIGCEPRSSLPVTAPSSSPKVAGKPQPTEYVGINRCAECHTQRVKEFRETRHFLACVEAQKVPMPVGFEAERNQYVVHSLGLQFEMTRLDGQYLMTAKRQSPQGEQRQTSRIDLVYGHGAGTDEAYFSWKGERMFELPMVWLHPQQRWAATPLNPFAEGDYSRPLTAQCLHCHNTWIDCPPGSTATFRRETALLGVTCERCHGPGRDHVAHHQQHREDRKAKAIVHPGELSRERLLDVCAQCHDNALKFRRPPFSYRPGEVLSDFIHITRFQYPEDDHVANQHGGMQASRCFQQSSTMTCVTCHDPHHARSEDNAGANSCMQCHKPTDCLPRKHFPIAVRGDCIGCHMPQSNKVQVNFRTEHDAYIAPVKRWEHRIAVYPAARDAVLLKWLKTQTDETSQKSAGQLAKSLGQHWRQSGEKLRGEYRFLMAIDAFRESQAIDPSPVTQQHIQELVKLQTDLDDKWFQAVQFINEQKLAQAITVLEEVLRLNPRVARVHGRLGTLYAATGDKDRGIQHLLTSNELDPNDSYGHGMLGWLAYLDHNAEQALSYFQKANDLEPMNPKLQYQLGLSFVALERWPDAASAFRGVLTISPDHLDACIALARVLLEQGRDEDAVKSAQRAAEISSDRDPDAQMLLSDCYVRVGRFAESRQCAERALFLAEYKNPELAHRARSRLQTLKSRTRQTHE